MAISSWKTLRSAPGANAKCTLCDCTGRQYHTGGWRRKTFHLEKKTIYICPACADGEGVRIGDDIEVEGSKTGTGHWFHARVSRLTETYLWYTKGSLEDLCGPLRRDCEGRTWRRIE